jgi:spore maturation protein CgeB
MKVLFCGYRNPNFRTITEYVEDAFIASGNEVEFFDDRDFILYARIRERCRFLNRLDLLRINRRLAAAAARIKPDVMFACGGLRILPETLAVLGGMGIKKILWTMDPPFASASPADDFRTLLRTAPLYDAVFCGGSEALELLGGAGVRGAVWMPFACEPAEHAPRKLTPGDRERFGCDICFVGTVDPVLYPGRVRLLESLCDMDLKVWGPGGGAVPASSPLKPRIMGMQTPPEVWTKIYSSAKIALCMHYSDPGGQYPCYQASPRVYEALACGAFLLCDAQKDVASLFEDGRHLVIFKDERDLREKVGYYLANPDKMAAIARAGRE